MKTWEELLKSTNVLQASMNELFEKYQRLQTFRDAAEWDDDAKALSDLLQKTRSEWLLLRKQQENQQAQLQQERNSKSFFARLFSSRSAETTVKNFINQIDAICKSIDTFIDNLTLMMDKTPANKSEQKEMSDELREIKKELSLQKRETNEKMRQTRTAARQQTANWTGVTGRAGRIARTSVRLGQERALAPLEDVKAVIEQQLIAMDRDLKWIMHFKADPQDGKNNSSAEFLLEQVQRCSYCGRRIADAEVCSGCGAII